jgi:hypothetical protein
VEVWVARDGVAEFFETLKESGFTAVANHFNTRGVRTNASASAMKAILEKTLAKRQQGLQFSFKNPHPLSTSITGEHVYG